MEMVLEKKLLFKGSILETTCINISWEFAVFNLLFNLELLFLMFLPRAKAMLLGCHLFKHLIEFSNEICRRNLQKSFLIFIIFIILSSLFNNMFLCESTRDIFFHLSCWDRYSLRSLFSWPTLIINHSFILRLQP